MSHWPITPNPNHQVEASPRPIRRVLQRIDLLCLVLELLQKTVLDPISKAEAVSRPEAPKPQLNMSS